MGGWFPIPFPALPPTCPGHPFRRLLESHVICTMGRWEWVWEHCPLRVPLQAPCQSSGQSLCGDLLGSRAAEQAQTQVTEQREIYHFQPRRCLFQQQIARRWGRQVPACGVFCGQLGRGCPHSSEAILPSTSVTGGRCAGSLTGAASTVPLSGPVCFLRFL